MQAVVLTAGAGTRLRPLTLTRSKAMAPVCGKPIVERLCERLVEAGLRDFVFVVADPDDDVARWARAWRGGDAVRLAVQPQRSGMGDALRHVAPFLTGEFLVSACDNLFDSASYAALVAHHRGRAGATATLSLERVSSPDEIRKTGIVTLRGDEIVGIVEKPEPDDAPSDISSMPCYVFSPRILGYLPELPRSARGEYELQDGIRMLIERDGGVQGLMIPARWHLTDTADLLAINRLFLSRGETRDTDQATCLPPVHIGLGAVIEPGCTFGPEAVLEDGCRVGAGATVRRAVVLRDAVVPPGAVVEDCLLGGEKVAAG